MVYEGRNIVLPRSPAQDIRFGAQMPTLALHIARTATQREIPRHEPQARREIPERLTRPSKPLRSANEWRDTSVATEQQGWDQARSLLAERGSRPAGVPWIECFV